MKVGATGPNIASRKAEIHSRESILDTVAFSCDISSPGENLPHFWEHTVGSCHAPLALRADWQNQIRKAHRDLGFRHVRFHDLFSETMGTFTIQKGQKIYSFFNVDQIIDYLLSIGVRPFLELSFMPKNLASGKRTVFHYQSNVTPPKDYHEWALLVEKLVRHCVERYGVTEVRKWYFEVWNEPNLKAFWAGNKDQYFKFYDVTARAVKRVHPKLLVGGPATAKNAWIREFLDACRKMQSPVDFVSTHHYPTDAFGQVGDDTIAQLAASPRSVLHDQAQKAHQESQGKPLYYTEWSTSSNPFDALHDQTYAAAYIIKTVLEARKLVDGYSYWTFSDIFEENYFSSEPFHGGFGIMNIHGIPKPSYRAFQLLHGLGNKIYRTEGTHGTADVWVTRHKKRLKVLVTNGALPRHSIRTQEIHVHLLGASTKMKSAWIERIDATHANARARWEKMGKPASLKPRQVAQLERASIIKAKPFKVHRQKDAHLLKIRVPPQGTVCVTLDLQ